MLQTHPVLPASVVGQMEAMYVNNSLLAIFYVLMPASQEDANRTHALKRKRAVGCGMK